MRHLTLPMLGFAAALAASPAGAGGLFVAGQESQSVLESDIVSWGLPARRGVDDFRGVPEPRASR